MNKIIAVGSDHGGFELKGKIIKMLEADGYEVKDCGAYDTASIDYPDVAEKLCETIVKGECEKGILICGTGIGMSIAANKIDGIRAAVCCDTYSAAMAREHNNANVITLGARVTGDELAFVIVKSWLNAAFAGGRHGKRVDKIMQLERRTASPAQE